MPKNIARGEIKLHLFAVVNPWLGPIYLEFVSGSQGVEQLNPKCIDWGEPDTFYVGASTPCSHSHALPY
jgi:hypothetical protein